MGRIFDYRNVVSILFAFALFVVLLQISTGLNNNQEHNRYKIATANNTVFLIDTKKGIVWKNVPSPNNIKALDSWLLMEYYGEKAPEGAKSKGEYKAPSTAPISSGGYDPTKNPRSLLYGYKPKY